MQREHLPCGKVAIVYKSPEDLPLFDDCFRVWSAKNARVLNSLGKGGAARGRARGAGREGSAPSTPTRPTPRRGGVGASVPATAPAKLGKRAQRRSAASSDEEEDDDEVEEEDDEEEGEDDESEGSDEEEEEEEEEEPRPRGRRGGALKRAGTAASEGAAAKRQRKRGTAVDAEAFEGRALSARTYLEAKGADVSPAAVIAFGQALIRETQKLQQEGKRRAAAAGYSAPADIPMFERVYTAWSASQQRP
eukprot:m51a1_g12076 hypothetical protein (249) ;mRNA; f:7-753